LVQLAEVLMWLVSQLKACQQLTLLLLLAAQKLALLLLLLLARQAWLALWRSGCQLV
jgi:hypothetical protein